MTHIVNRLTFVMWTHSVQDATVALRRAGSSHAGGLILGLTAVLLVSWLFLVIL